MQNLPSFLRTNNRLNRIGLRAQVILYLAILLTVLVTLASVVSGVILRNSLLSEFRSTSRIIAQDLVSNVPEYLIARDLSELQAVLNTFSGSRGVSYLMIQNPDGDIVGHTFAPIVPGNLAAMPKMPANGRGLERTLSFFDAEKNNTRNALELALPVAEGHFGIVRVGLDLDLINQEVTRAVGTLVLSLLALGIIVELLGIWFSVGFTRPLRRLARLAGRIGLGDLSQTVDIERGDEVGLLAETLNRTVLQLRQIELKNQEERERSQRLQENIRTFLNVAQDIAMGDLQKRGEVTEDVLGNVVDAINVMVEELGYVLIEVQDASHAMDENAEQLRQTTDLVATSSLQTTKESEHVDTEIAQLLHGLRQTAQTAGSSATAAIQTLRASEQGQKAVEDTLEGMQLVRQNVAYLSRQVQDLSSRSEQISQVAETIANLASQINLLSLHASLEAAGAGEAGARFATVAQEVQQLAESAATASQQVTQLIRTVRNDIDTASTAVQTGQTQVEQGYAVATQAGIRLQEISNLSKQSAAFAERISTETQTQVQRAEQASQSTQAIRALASSAQNNVVQGQNMVQRVQDLAQQLKELLERFKL